MDYTTITQKAENFVTNLFEKNKQDALTFHNLEHTRGVVARAKEIGSQFPLSEKDQAILYISAWFHDTGHLFVEPAMHEVKSIELMKSFLNGLATNEAGELAPAVEKCILATRVPGHPKTLTEQIICDADTYHIGTDDFKKTNKQLKKEYIRRKLISPQSNWNKKSLEFMESHRFYTLYCQGLLEEGKQRNIEWLRKKTIKNEMEENMDDMPKKLNQKNAKEIEKQKANLLGKGIQTMLRLTSSNHLDLSEMADRKANILISVNALIISVILSVLLRRLDVDTYLTIPTITFLVFSLATIVIAILATLPKVSGGRFSREDILHKKTNLLFFGNFHKATLQEYQWGMQEMMKDQEYLYGALIKDIYYLGVILGRKYKLLRIAYYIFMIGIIISVLAFAIAVALNKGGSSATSPPMPF
jgi:HD-GYP domain-containing protein (c-di-GMP phosphodiesterase class II)